MSAIAGRVLIMPKGAYNGATTYRMLDVVSYNGNSYIAKKTTQGNTPIDTEYWQLLADGSTVASINDIADVVISLPEDGQVLKYNSETNEWVNADASGGGHTIQDDEGTALTQRSNLQFKGVLQATDDSTNNATVVEVAEQSVHANILTKLWENPDPSAPFAAQNISLASDDYDFTYWDVNLTSGYHITYIVPKGQSNPMFFSGTTNGSYVITRQRNAVYVNDTTYSVEDARTQNSNAVFSVNNALLVPIAVYGLKKSLDITAIVSNVSTDARQCMLSDGVTSVENKINGLTTTIEDSSSVSNVTFLKSGNVATMILNGYQTTSNSPQFAVPLEFRPSFNYVLTIAYNYTDKVACFVDIGSGGAVRVRSLSNADIAGKTIYGTLTYVI